MSGASRDPPLADCRRHDPADHVRAAVRVRLRRRDRDAGRGLHRLPHAWGHRAVDGLRRVRHRARACRRTKKGLIDRFRSLPMWTPAVLTGRVTADIATNVIQLVIMFTVGIAVGFASRPAPRRSSPGSSCSSHRLAFSWVFAFIGLVASSPEAANASGSRPFPDHVHHSRVRADGVDAELVLAAAEDDRSPRWSTPPARSS